jgi:tRNA(Met) C34 N-acetyltransferase TmcA
MSSSNKTKPSAETSQYKFDKELKDKNYKEWEKQVEKRISFLNVEDVTYVTNKNNEKVYLGNGCSTLVRNIQSGVYYPPSK